MRAMMVLAVKDVMKRWTLALILALLFASTFAAFVTLFTYQRSVSALYITLQNDWLVVGNSDGLSELHGSRLTPEIGDLLVSKGYADPIPEIHQIVGTSLSNGILMRGIQLDRYQQVVPFTLLAGKALQPGDPSRTVMLGETLARTKKAQLGDDFMLRGRKFTVVGIFATGSIQDNEAWISLEDAQKLLNYGEDVSLYLIPNNGVLQPGTLLSDDILVSQHGETTGVFGASITSFFSFMGVIGALAGVATAVTLANLLWRLAFLRRREFGILRSVGFNFRALLVYFITQSGLILSVGVVCGVALAYVLLFGKLDDLSAFGLGLSRSMDAVSILGMVMILFTMLFIGVFFPLASIRKTSIPELLGRN